MRQPMRQLMRAALLYSALAVLVAEPLGTPANAQAPAGGAERGGAEVLMTGIVALDRLLHLTPLLGVGWSTESGALEPAFYYTVGLALEIRPSFNHAVLLSLTSSAYRRTYIEDRIDPARGGLGRTPVDERKWAFDGLYAYDLLESADRDRRIAGEVLGGVLFRSFDNAAHPQSVFAAAVGFRFAVAMSRHVDFSAHLLYGYNLVPPSTSFTSFNGEPRSLFAYSGALGFRVAPASRVRVGYVGEAYPLGRSYLLFHGAQVAYDISF